MVYFLWNTSVLFFDEGYNKLREQIFENQKKLGVIPADTKLEPWPDDVIKPWDECTPEEKKLFIKQVEVFSVGIKFFEVIMAVFIIIEVFHPYITFISKLPCMVNVNPGS